MDDLLAEFLTEVSESLGQLDLDLVKLEQNPNNPPLISSIFRLVHTIKGTCGFLGLPRLEKVAHASENILGRFRDGDLVVTQSSVTLILRALDSIKGLLGALEANGAEPVGDDAELIALLDAAAGAAPEAVAIEAPSKDAVTDDALDWSDDTFDLDAFEPVRFVPEQPAAAARPVAPPVAPPVTPMEPAHDMAAGPAESSVANQSIRVQLGLLESLMTTVSELVLTRNQLLQILRGKKESEFDGPLQRLNQVVSDLQEGVMKTRMQPIGNAWSKLPRIIRDLSCELGKKIELEMLGADTELDRQVLELIKDPLTHMVRNSADHGIERPEDRVLAGKPETGRVVLNAFHRGGHIIIEISDDGRGLDVGRIRAKALAKGLASETELAGLSDNQIQQFIFRAGLSTAEIVTAVSGRGVGMDVVKTNIEKIGGTIELASTPGTGSVFTIKIPLTLAIVSALIVESGRERFAIPQLAVVELVRASEQGASEHRIERIKGTPVLRLRDRLLPLISLDGLLELPPAEVGLADERFIVVTQVGGHVFGLIVDRVFDTEEIVVKPVARIARHIPMFSGNTILGDGSVIMILDMNGIATAASGIVETPRAVETARRAGTEGATTSLLLFRAGAGGVKAVPLSLIARLEEFDRSKIETIDGRRVIQYRGKIMPLVEVIGAAPRYETEGRQPVLVFADKDRAMGLEVDQIIDIVEARIDLQLNSDSPGVIGGAIIGQTATEMIDVGYYLTRAFADWFGAQGAATTANTGLRKVLIVEDSPFFRSLLIPLLQGAGYDVTSVGSGIEALALRDDGSRFDAIVSDIEMPGMSGFDFAQEVKRDARWSHTPMLALSSLVNAPNFTPPVAVFNDYVAKLDRAELLEKLSRNVSTLRRAA